ncbi:MAG: VCBS repeat-containing protein, partial [Candidatus Eremiobacteraeota bacterium]|nr:VCBS repeat-containing protein [Candidatus Eremiobacteraeota bacterium]
MVNAQNTFTTQPALQTGAAFSFNLGAASTAPLAQMAFQVGVQAPINATYQGWDSFLGGGSQLFGGLPFNSNAASSPFGSMAQIGMLFTLIQALSALFQSNQVASPQPYQPQPYQPQPAPYQDLHYQPPVQEPPPASYQHQEVKAEVKPVVQEQNQAELRAQIEAEVRLQVQQEVQAQAQLDFGGGDGDGGGGGDGTPIILDLNGDGKLDVTGKGGDMIDFDLFGNGNSIKTEWLKKGTQDGLLVADFNGDGKIDSGRELMRNTGENGEQHKYDGGWDKLGKLFDKNG